MCVQVCVHDYVHKYLLVCVWVYPVSTHMCEYVCICLWVHMHLSQTSYPYTKCPAMCLLDKFVL